MATPTVFDDALDLLEGKFTNDPAKRKGGLLTAYAAVKLAFGVKRDDPAFAYNGSSWPVLAARLSAAFAALDEVVEEHTGKQAAFSVWASRPERTEVEVREVMREAARRNPEMVVEERAQLRPSVPKMPGMRKARWVICNQLALIAAGRSSSLGAVVASILPFDDATNVETITRLDGIIHDGTIPWERPKGLGVAVSMSRAWGTKTRNYPTFSFARFMREFDDAMWFDATNDELTETFDMFVEAHEDDLAPSFDAPILG